MKKVFSICLSFVFLVAIFWGNAWAPDPAIEIIKQVSVDGGQTWFDADTFDTAPSTSVGSGVNYKLIVRNTGNTPLENAVINDPTLGIVAHPISDLQPGDEITLLEGDIPQLYQPDRCQSFGDFQNIASVQAEFAAGTIQVTDEDPAWVSCLEIANEGCTPGFWKAEQHFVNWIVYSPADSFSGVFGEAITIRWSEKGKPEDVGDPTLLQALEAKGGGINALARHAVAALLNAANPDVAYFYSESEIIEKFQLAIGDEDFEYTKDLFKDENELGCPLNNSQEIDILVD